MASTVLNTWKEISAYTGRGIRTIQRWETSFEFPIHRPSGKSRSAVFALTDEIDQWFHSRPMLPVAERKQQSTARVGTDFACIRTTAHQLLARGDATQQLMLEIQKNLSAAIGKATKYRRLSQQEEETASAA